MKRSLFLLVLVVVLLPMPLSQALAGDEPAPLTLEKECVLFGRILNSHVLLYPGKKALEPGGELPKMTQVGGLEVLNTVTGEWHPLSLSEDGYFCANLGMGKYELRGRNCNGMPYVIHSFTIPKGMAANLGDFWVETCDLDVIERENWHSHFREGGWQEYRQASGKIGMRFEHITTEKAYEDCRIWFARCHEEAYSQFAQLVARR
jgi:hypothetical protein